MSKIFVTLTKIDWLHRFARRIPLRLQVSVVSCLKIMAFASTAAFEAPFGILYLSFNRDEPYLCTARSRCLTIRFACVQTSYNFFYSNLRCLHSGLRLWDALAPGSRQTKQRRSKHFDRANWLLSSFPEIVIFPSFGMHRNHVIFWCIS